MVDKVLSLLGMAQKAGKVASGEFMVEQTVKSKKAYLVIVSEEASKATIKSYIDMCKFYKVPMYLYGNNDTLGHCIGKEFRVAVCVTDVNLSRGIIKKLEETGNTEVNR